MLGRMRFRGQARRAGQSCWVAGTFAGAMADAGAVTVMAGLLRTAMAHKWDHLVFAGAAALAATVSSLQRPLQQVQTAGSPPSGAGPCGPPSPSTPCS